MLWMPVVKPTGRASFPHERPIGSPENALRLTVHMFNDAEHLDTLLAAIQSACPSHRG